MPHTIKVNNSEELFQVKFDNGDETAVDEIPEEGLAVVADDHNRSFIVAFKNYDGEGGNIVASKMYAASAVSASFVNDSTLEIEDDDEEYEEGDDDMEEEEGEEEDVEVEEDE